MISAGGVSEMKRGPYKKAPVNIEDVHIDEGQGKDARIKSYLKQVKDPYRVKISGVLVEMEYSENGYTLQQAIETITGIDQ